MQVCAGLWEVALGDRPVVSVTAGCALPVYTLFDNESLTRSHSVPDTDPLQLSVEAWSRYRTLLSLHCCVDLDFGLAAHGNLWCAGWSVAGCAWVHSSQLVWTALVHRRGRQQCATWGYILWLVA